MVVRTLVWGCGLKAELAALSFDFIIAKTGGFTVVSYHSKVVRSCADLHPESFLLKYINMLYSILLAFDPISTNFL